MRGFALIALILLAPVPASAEVVSQRGDWLLVCDNHADCTIMGAPGEGVASSYPHVEVRIFRRDRPGHPPLLTTRTTDPSAALNLQVRTLAGMSLASGGFAEPMARLQPDPDAGTPGVDTFSSEDSGPLVQVLAQPGPLVVRSGFGLFAVLPQGDLAALLARMDRAQPRVAAPPDPTVEDLPLPAPILYELFPREPAATPPAHPAFEQACPDPVDRQVGSFTLDHTTSPTMLVHLACGGQHYFYLWNPLLPGSQPSGLTLRRAREQRFPASQVMLDADTGTVTVLDHPPGRTDCGAETMWGWVDGTGMVLLRRRVMPLCRGIAADRWPVAFLLDGWAVR